jgi:A/G-specific adenine glycosylase
LNRDPDPVAPFAAHVIAWQRTHGRHDLPWQGTRDPYRIWLSEIMLQQTQVATVKAYYLRFLERFPDVASLAAAPLDDVLALWSGLGYYSRARHLHACAQAVMARHGGHFPAASADLAELPGIGRSTAAAIAAFCFGERVAILDGNVKRVLTRVLGFAGDLAEPAQERALWNDATRLLPERDGMVAYTQGLMDLGATICLARSPSCLVCPVRPDCVAAGTGTQDRYPVKTKKLKRGARENWWLWLAWGERVWLVQRPERGVWAGLWSLPELASAEDFEAAVRGWPGQAVPLRTFTHVLTHLDWTLHPTRWELPARTAVARADALAATLGAGRWFTRDEAFALGLPAPVRRLLQDQDSTTPLLRK